MSENDFCFLAKDGEPFSSFCYCVVMVPPLLASVCSLFSEEQFCLLSPESDSSASSSSLPMLSRLPESREAVLLLGGPESTSWWL
jgi:hypothetical protein